MTAPDLSTYRAVHLALRGGADAMAAVAATVQPGNRPKVDALRRYWAGYSAELHKHHTTEDDIFFPALVERVPVAATLIERTDAEHHELDAVMARCHTAVSALAGGVRTADLGPAFADLAALMHHHLDFEDEDLIPLFERHFTAEDHDALEKQAMEALDLRGALFTVPFVMHFADPDERGQLLAGAPVAFRVLYRLTRRGHTRLAAALGIGAATAAPAAARARAVA